MARFLLGAPLVFYGTLALAYVVTESLGVDATAVHMKFWAFGSFLFFFYIAYFALWKLDPAPRRFGLAAILAFAPWPVLALLDFAGVELITVPHAHGLTLSSTTLWFTPGMYMAEPFEVVVRRLKPPEPVTAEQTYVGGAFDQPDGSLILYGSTAAGQAGEERQTFKVLGRIDPAGNRDTSFSPRTMDLSGVIDTFKQPDGTVLVETDTPRSHYLRIVEISPGGAVKEVVRVTDYPIENQPELRFAPWAAIAPVPFLPGWLSMQPRLIRLRADGSQDEAFNAQAAKVLGEQHLGDYYAAGLDTQGSVTVAFARGLLRLDSTGRLLPPGVVVFDEVESGERRFGGLTGVTFLSDGSIFVSAGDESSAKSLPRLMRFDANLKEDRALSDATSRLAPGAGRFHVLGFRGGGVVASLVERMHGSRILFLGAQGQLMRAMSW
jgi:hypothetical protein